MCRTRSPARGRLLGLFIKGLSDQLTVKFNYLTHHKNTGHTDFARRDFRVSY